MCCAVLCSALLNFSVISNLMRLWFLQLVWPKAGTTHINIKQEIKLLILNINLQFKKFFSAYQTYFVRWRWLFRTVVVVQLQPHELQHARFPCPWLSPRVCSNPCPLCRWCHPTISSSVIPFSFCHQYFPSSGSFPMSQLLSAGGQSIGASASVLPMNIQGWYP